MTQRHRPTTILGLWILIALATTGCTTIVRQAPPENSLAIAQVYGMSDIRAISGTPSQVFIDDFVSLVEHREDANEVYKMLAVSGGGANGAYGAGMLNGWSQSGTRPTFKIVTGISTGAIIAPYAFLGSSYDARLKEFYTSYATRDIIQFHFPFSVAIGNMKPLEEHIRDYFDAKVLQDVAAEYHKGRRLYVGTTDLDAQKLVIWDMGKIAAQGDDKALKLFRKVILASSSIPIITQPVYLDVELGDKTYTEMHVDGGVVKQVFFLYDVMEGFGEALKQHGVELSGDKYQIYIIRNGYVDPIYKEVPSKLSAIAGRTIDTITNNQGIGDIYQIYTYCTENNASFNLAYIPTSHVSIAKQLFDPEEMRELFDLGCQTALQGYPWKKTPPGYVNSVAVKPSDPKSNSWK